MKVIGGCLLFLLCANTSVCVANDVSCALRNGALGKYTYRVVDDEGNAVSNAQAHVWFKSYGRPQDKADWIVETDTNGMFTAEHRFNEKFSVGIDKEGYYHSYDTINYLSMPSLPVKDGKWQPYGELRTLTLKRIRNPRKMNGAESYVDFKIPAYDVWVGFDFDENQFVSPYGKGKFSDVLLRFSLTSKSRNDYHMSMEVSFTNQVFAGAYVLKQDSQSEMKSVYSADPGAPFVQSLVYRYDRPVQNSNLLEKLTEDKYMVFRSRTVVDENGHLISARYGKIYGPWHYVGPRGMSIRSVCFNPMPNDTNLEDARTVEDNERKWGCSKRMVK